MPRGIKRIIAGVVLVGIGVFGWYRALLDSVPQHSPPHWYGVNLSDSLPVIIVHSIIAGVGVWALVGGMRASRSSP